MVNNVRVIVLSAIVGSVSSCVRRFVWRRPCFSRRRLVWRLVSLCKFGGVGRLRRGRANEDVPVFDAC